MERDSVGSNHGLLSKGGMGGNDGREAKLMTKYCVCIDGGRDDVLARDDGDSMTGW